MTERGMSASNDEEPDDGIRFMIWPRSGFARRKAREQDGLEDATAT